MENQYQDMMLAKFRQHYPHGSLLSDLIEIDRGLYIVKVSLEVDNVILATALAAADQVEVAEDHARTRAIAALMLDIQPTTTQAQPISPQTSISEPNLTASNPTGTLSSNSKSQPDLTFTPPNTYSAPVEVEQESETATIPNSGNLFEGTGEMVVDNQLDNQDKVAPTSIILNSDNLFDSATEILADEPEIDNQFETFLYDENVTTATTQIETLDFEEIVNKTEIEIKRLGWTRDDGREFLQSRYGKRSRLHLTDEQLLEFLRYLEKLPTPVK